MPLHAGCAWAASKMARLTAWAAPSKACTVSSVRSGEVASSSRRANSRASKVVAMPLATSPAL